MRRFNKELYNELARLTYKYREYEGVDCIYLMPHTMHTKTDIYSFIIVFREPLKDRNIANEIDIYNINNKSELRKTKFGGEIRIMVDDSQYYVLPPITYREDDKAVALKSSHILFDRTGVYTKITKEKYVDKYINCFKLPKARKLIKELNKQDKR